MEAKLRLTYDREGDILHIDTCSPYAGGEGGLTSDSVALCHQLHQTRILLLGVLRRILQRFDYSKAERMAKEEAHANSLYPSCYA